MFIRNLLKILTPTLIVINQGKQIKSSQFICAKLESLNSPDLIYLKKIKFFTNSPNNDQHQISPKKNQYISKRKGCTEFFKKILGNV